MHNSLFLRGWNHVVDSRFLDSIKTHFESVNCPVLGDLSFSNYSIGIKLSTGIHENGLYIFRFADSFYVGKATSCTLLERLGKHFDSRSCGGFNGLLRKLHPIDKSLSNFELNQQIMVKSKLLLIPIDSVALKRNNAGLTDEKCIDILEMDLILMLRDVFMCNEINAKKKVKLSGLYFKG